MRRPLVMLVAVFISFVFVTHALSQTALTGGPKAEGKRLSGTVVAVDAASKTLVVKNWRGKTIFDTTDAKLVRRTNLEDIRPGDKVVMSYVEEGGRKTAKVLIATPGKLEEDNETEAPKGPKPVKNESVKK